jgi:hypothetical protein
MPCPKGRGQITKAPVHGRMLNMGRIGSARTLKFAIITAVTFPAGAQGVPLCSRVLIRQSLRDVKAVKDMGMAKVWRLQCSVAAICLLAALLAGCSRIRTCASRSTWRAASATSTKASTGRRQFSSRTRSRSMTRFRRRPLQAGADGPQTGTVANAYQELSKTIELQPDHYAAQLDWPTC